MNNQPTLFNVPPTAPSKESRLRAFCREHGILTCRCSLIQRKDEPWLALLPTKDDVGKPMDEIIAESARYYDESDRVATGTGKLSAVRQLCEQMGIECAL